MIAFLACAVFGAVLLVAQLAAGVGSDDAGGHGHAHEHAHEHAHGAEAAHAARGAEQRGHPLAGLGAGMVGLRPLAAAVAFFGLAGAAVLARGGGVPAALVAAVPAGVVAAALTAALLRLLLRFESDGAVRLDAARGADATVYVPIPPGGAGKVQLALQGRLVECTATAADTAAYPTGARVLVVDVTPDGGLLVAADPAAPPARGPLPHLRSTPS